MAMTKINLQDKVRPRGHNVKARVRDDRYVIIVVIPSKFRLTFMRKSIFCSRLFHDADVQLSVVCVHRISVPAVTGEYHTQMRPAMKTTIVRGQEILPGDPS